MWGINLFFVFVVFVLNFIFIFACEYACESIEPDVIYLMGINMYKYKETSL